MLGGKREKGEKINKLFAEDGFAGGKRCHVERASISLFSSCILSADAAGGNTLSIGIAVSRRPFTGT